MTARHGAMAFLVAIIVWVAFNLIWKIENAHAPSGDASYYTSMTYAFFSDHRSEIEVSSLHGKRILGPFLVACMLWVQGFDNTLPLKFSYSATHFPPESWSSFQTQAYAKIFYNWWVLNALTFGLLAMALLSLLPVSWPGWLKTLVFANFLLTPSLGLLNVYWVEMNDILTLLFFVLGLVHLKKNRESLGLLCIGLSALGREQVLMVLPFVFMFKRFSIVKALILAVVPFGLVALFPPFPNFVAWADGASEIDFDSKDVVFTYFKLLQFHVTALLSQRGLAHPFAIFINLGATLGLCWAAGILRDKRIWVLLGMSFIFMADRHMFLLALIGLMGPIESILEDRTNSLRKFLIGALIFKVLMLVTAPHSYWIQAEHWFRLLPPRQFRILFQVIWGFTLLGLGVAWFYYRKTQRNLISATHNL